MTGCRHALADALRLPPWELGWWCGALWCLYAAATPSDGGTSLSLPYVIADDVGEIFNIPLDQWIWLLLVSEQWEKMVSMSGGVDRRKCPQCIATLRFSCLVLLPSCCSAQLYKPALWFANINSVLFSHLRDNQWEMEKGVPRPQRLPPTVIYWFYTKSDRLIYKI